MKDNAAGVSATQNVDLWFQVSMMLEYWKNCGFTTCPNLGSYYCQTAYNPTGYAQKTAFTAVTYSSTTLKNATVSVRYGSTKVVNFIGDAGPTLNNDYWNTGSIPSTGGCLTDLLATDLGYTNYGCNGSMPYGGPLTVFWRLKPATFAGILVNSLLGCSLGWGWGDSMLPPGASIYKQDQVLFSTGARPLKVVFYEVEGVSVGVEVVSLTNGVLARAQINTPCRFLSETGVYDLTGDTNKQIVLDCQVGADSTWAQVYSFERGALVKIKDWSGWNFRVVELRDHPLVAYQECHTVTACLPDLYAWKDASFKKVNSEFPEYYETAIGDERSFIEGDGEYVAAVFGQTCRLGSQALVYGRRYDEARSLCERALQVVKTGERVVPENSHDLPEQVEVERLKAEKEITARIIEIDKAQGLGSLELRR